MAFYLSRSKITATVAVAGLIVASASAQKGTHVKPANTGLNGQQIFASACASCHGLDGRGGERAPNIAESAAVQRLSDTELTRIVTEGVPGTGMPAFHSLGSFGISSVVKYLRVLQGRGQPSALPGNAARGQALFFGGAGCASCHMVDGKGGFLASDLSSFGKGHSVDEIRQAILDPSRDPEMRAKHAVVTSADGKQYDGMVRNEDNFSIQLQDKDGSFHFIEREDIKNVQYQTAPVMPANYGTVLTSSEINDIISYLVRAAKGSKTERAAEADD